MWYTGLLTDPGVSTNLNLSGVINSNVYYNAKNNISSTQTLQSGDIFYFFGGEVQLNPSFESSTYFEVINENYCP